MIEFSTNLKKCIEFHGHFCPGLAYGYLIAEESLKILGVDRAEDEEIVVISESDSCTIDAFQVILGTTLGKGNLIIKNYGKSVYTVYGRKNKKAFRFSKKHGCTGIEKEGLQEVGYEMLNKNANSKDKKRQKYLKGCGIIQKSCKEVFDINPLKISEPLFAVLDESLLCEECGEYTMSSMILNIKGKNYCIPCAKVRIERL